MKRSPSVPRASQIWATIALLALSSSPARAQRVEPDTSTPQPTRKVAAAVQPTQSANASNSPNQDTSDDVTKLSPFVVQSSSNDIGYYAENTLAGSRLNTNLGDLAASITVVTRQQMLDTASLDMNDIFLYEANTEGTLNYTSFTFGDQGNVVDNTGTNPSGANRVRGVGAVDRAHNFYYSITALPFDVYNTESVEINRGPNSLLFGLGSGIL